MQIAEGLKEEYSVLEIPRVLISADESLYENFWVFQTKLDKILGDLVKRFGNVKLVFNPYDKSSKILKMYCEQRKYEFTYNEKRDYYKKDFTAMWVYKNWLRAMVTYHVCFFDGDSSKYDYLIKFFKKEPGKHQRLIDFSKYKEE